MFNEFLNMFQVRSFDLPSVGQLILILLVLTLYGFVVSITYWFSDKDRTPSQGYAMTLVIIPPIVAMIIMMIGNNLAGALSLGGAFAIIRYRSVPSDPKDISYVLLSMAIGLTGGRGLMLYALCLTLTLCLVMFALQQFSYAKPKRIQKTLRITIPENFNHQNAFDDIFMKYSVKSAIKRIRTTDMGSLFEVTYEVTVPEGVHEKALLDDIRTRNGNLPVVLVLAETTAIPFWV